MKDIRCVLHYDGCAVSETELFNSCLSTDKQMYVKVNCIVTCGHVCSIPDDLHTILTPDGGHD